jgi:hypothetical protein
MSDAGKLRIAREYRAKALLVNLRQMSVWYWHNSSSAPSNTTSERNAALNDTKHITFQQNKTKHNKTKHNTTQHNTTKHSSDNNYNYPVDLL